MTTKKTWILIVAAAVLVTAGILFFAKDTTSQTVAVGSSISAMGVTISPLEIVSDSRCPSGVQCVWAGTVEVRASLETGGARNSYVFKLGEPYTFEGLTITLKEVTPGPKEGQKIPSGDYRLTFEVKK